MYDQDALTNEEKAFLCVNRPNPYLTGSDGDTMQTAIRLFESYDEHRRADITRSKTTFKEWLVQHVGVSSKSSWPDRVRGILTSKMWLRIVDDFTLTQWGRVAFMISTFNEAVTQKTPEVRPPQLDACSVPS